MIRSKLVTALAEENAHLPRPDVERVVNVIFDTIIGTLEEGGRVELRGFGAFSVRGRAGPARAQSPHGRRFRLAPRRWPSLRAARSCANV